ncbi:MAG: RIP metalloprotease RseP [Candidatus Doudnabacteria bacterium]|nr:RIP metalloprotease RseP [Candidatus Doudnabacteria bacterium]
MILLTIAIFILILGLLIFVHELGHFIMAKRAGMRVEEFGFGFPPRIFGITRGETTYSLNLIPLGGFVKITGENGEQSDDQRSFVNKSAWQRFSVLIAGVSMNVVLAWVLISIGLGIGLPTMISEGESLSRSAEVRNVQISVVEVSPDSPAASASVKPGDSIVQINGQPISSIEELQIKTVENSGRETVYEFKRGDETFSKTLVPRSNPPAGEGPLGVAMAQVAQVSYPWYETPFRGLAATVSLTWATLTAFATIIGQWIGGQSVSGSLSGPVGIAVLTRDVAALGLIYLLQFTALLSVNLAIINAVPFPALDGGRVLFLLIEKIRGRKMGIKAEQVANTVGFSLLILLMIFVTVKDVTRYGDGFKRLFERIF